MLRRNGPIIKTVESVLRPEESLWWERFVKEIDFEAGVKERARVMDCESGELTEWEDVVGAWRGRTESAGLEWGWRNEFTQNCGNVLKHLLSVTLGIYGF